MTITVVVESFSIENDFGEYTARFTHDFLLFIPDTIEVKVKSLPGISFRARVSWLPKNIIAKRMNYLTMRLGYVPDYIFTPTPELMEWIREIKAAIAEHELIATFPKE